MDDCLRKILHAYPIDLNDEKVMSEPVSSVEAAGERFILVNHPNYIQQILEDKNGNYSKAQFSSAAFESLIGKGLLTSEGELWRRQRKSLNPAFRKKKLNLSGELISNTTHTYLKQLEEQIKQDPVVDFNYAMIYLTLSIFTKAFFSISLTPQEVDKIIKTEKIMTKIIDSASLNQVGLEENEEYIDALKVYDDFAYNLIDERKKSNKKYDDVVDMLIASQQENPEITDQELRDEIISLLVGGHETCANAATFTGYILSQNKDVETQLRDEVKMVVGSRDVEASDLDQLTWPQMVFKEVLRLFPPAYIIHRTAINDDEIDGHKIPAKAIVTVCPWLTHRNPNYWEEPFTFKPTRFMTAPENFTFIPFGLGSRVCLGQGFAMIQGPLIVAALAQHFTFELPKDQKVSMYCGLLTRPRYGLHLILKQH